MAFDELLAQRVHSALPENLSNFIEVKQMFGGIAWTLNGHLAFGILGDEFMVRLGTGGRVSPQLSPGSGCLT